MEPYEHYKDSGVPWIGKIPTTWRVAKTLRLLAMPITDGPHETPELLEDGIPFISAEAVSTGAGSINFSNKRGFISESYYEACSKKYHPETGDVYMIKSGATTGRVAMVAENTHFAIWSPLAVFRANHSLIEARFLFYALQSHTYQTQVALRWNYGTQQNIGMRTLERLQVSFPNLKQQQTISVFLDVKTAEIDGVVEKLTRQRGLLERYKRELIAHTVTKGLNPNAPMKDSGYKYVGKHPTHWTDRPLLDLCDLVKTLNNDLTTNIAMQFKDGEIVPKSNWDDSRQNLETIADYTKIQAGMIVINGLNLNYDFKTKRVGLVRATGAITSAYIVLNPHFYVEARYLNYLLKSIDDQKAFHGMTEGVRKILNWKDVRRLMLPFPEPTEQRAIADYLDAKTAEVDGLARDLDRQIELLGKYRKQVINDVVTGKVRVGKEA